MSDPKTLLLSSFPVFADLGAARVLDNVANSLRGFDDGELYLQYGQTEHLLFDDGRIKSCNFDVTQGFGLRAVMGETIGYAHGNALTLDSFKEASTAVTAIKKTATSATTRLVAGASVPAHDLYSHDNPLQAGRFDQKVKLLQAVDAYARQKSNQVVQVSVSLSGEWDVIGIFRADGFSGYDVRPLVRFNVSVVLSDGIKQESGSHGLGGRYAYDDFFRDEKWTSHVDEAFRMAEVKLRARPAPAGEMPVVLGNGWCGVLLHEAIGHGLEGDFNRKKTSAFSERMGQNIAAKGVTVVDDGTLPHHRGSINMDDEGTPSQRNVLIEDGRLVGYLQDRLNARLMGTASTGSGRRQSFAYPPMPRMTNTYMLAGTASKDDLLREVKRGLYAVNFGGGQVDITSGKYVFSATEAYMIENGQITYPVKGATLIGDGPSALTRIRAVGNDLALDPGIGSCGKDGQSVPVGVGQPSLLLDGITVGGTEE